MNILTIIFYTLAIIIAAYSGYNDFAWYFIVVSSLMFSLGWLFDRLTTIPHLLKKISIFSLIFNQIIIYSIPASIIYFVAFIFGN